MNKEKNFVYFYHLVVKQKKTENLILLIYKAIN